MTLLKRHSAKLGVFVGGIALAVLFFLDGAGGGIRALLAGGLALIATGLLRMSVTRDTKNQKLYEKHVEEDPFISALFLTSGAALALTLYASGVFSGYFEFNLASKIGFIAFCVTIILWFITPRRK